METQDTTPPDTAPGALSPPVAAWFRARYGQPTPIQRFAWPRLVAGGHLLLSAPTGTGKTLAAFLPVLDALCAGCGDSERYAASGGRGVACLYIAPLKALCNDTLRTLEAVLSGLRPYFPEGVSFPAVGIRTGDTSAEERRLLREAPPEVLLTTPESLAVLLSQPALRETFAPLRWVIVDEVHALVGEKRGADLALSLERLADLADGEVQRVGLSATATPLELTARYLAGQDRPCDVARVGESAPLHLRVETLPGERGFLSRLVERLLPELQGQRSTLIFTNTRGLTERLAWGLRRALPEWDGLIAVHHSALAAPRREEVERDFKAGRLRAVVSSTSLELGIDIGTVDLVVLVHPPGDVIRLLQRVGRSGHAPGLTGGRRGLLLADTAGELLEAAVTAAAGQAGQCEPLRLCPAPLDVLCQQLAGMACARWWSAEEAFALCRRAAPYGDLSREDFDACLRYLLGEDREGEPWLPARVRPDGDGFVIRDGGTARLLRRNLGTILGEEAVPVLVEMHREGEFPDARAIGEVDPAFADRLQAGDRFLLDGRCLEFRRRVEGGLLVEETPGRPRVPRWGGEGWPLSPALARRLFLLRVRAAEALREGPGVLEALLQLEYELDAPAAALLAGYFQSQERISEIPDRSFLLVEAVASEWGVDCHVHTPLNRPANDALARVAVRRLLRDGRSATSQVADLGFALQMRGPIADPAGLMRQLLRAEGFEADLDEALAGCAGLRERFGRVATTGLMLLRNPTGGRRRVGGRDWGGRELFDRVRAREPDFVLLRQALAEVRGSVCDLACAADYLHELAGLPIRCRWLRCPSPLVGAWTQVTAGPVEEAETPAEGLARLHALLTGGGP